MWECVNLEAVYLGGGGGGGVGVRVGKLCAGRGCELI